MARKVRPARHYQRRDAPIRLIADHGVPGIKRDIKASLKHLSTLVPPVAVQYARAGDWHGLKRSIAWGHFREILKAPFARIGKVREAGAQFGARQINGKFRQARRRVRFRKGERHFDISPPSDWTVTDIREFFGKARTDRAREDVRRASQELKSAIQSGNADRVRSARADAKLERQRLTAALEAEDLKKYSPDQPRDDHGRWTSGGDAESRQATIRAGGKDVSVTLSRVSQVTGERLVELNVSAFNDSWKKDPSFYVGPGGRLGDSGEMSGRYERFQQWLAQNNHMEASEVGVQANGRVGFTNGRHRFAVLRDMGVEHIPVAMDRESIANAERHGYVHRVRKSSDVFDILFDKAVGDDFNVDPYDEALQERIREAQDTLIQILENAAQDAIDQVVASGVEDGLGPDEIVDEIRDLIGLTDTQAQAVANYRDMLENLDSDALERRLRNVAEDDAIAEAIEAGEDLAAAYIDQMVSDYTDNFLDYRADMIAQTEATRAANAGLQDAYQQSIDRGVFPSDAVRQYWTVALDERTCEICLSIPDMNEEGVAIGDPFDSIDGPMDAPPDPHTNCRCSLEIITDLDKVPDQEQEEAA